MKKSTKLTAYVLGLAIGFAIPVAAQQPSEYILKVSPAETDLISKGLQTQPFGEVYPLINKLREQIIAQQPKPVEAPKVVEPAK
jgi:hypothetical protein